MITAAVLVTTTLIAARWLLPDRRAFEHAHEAAPSPGTSSRAIIGRLFLVGLAIALAEAPPNEWAALLMTDRFDVGPGAAGLGFVAVAGGMLVGRVVGDHVTDRYGLERTRRGGAALAAVGVLVATLAPSPVGAGIGLFITGLGLSSLFPLLFRAASELTHGSHSGMAAFSSGARLGFLIASPLIGVLASGTSVAIAVLLVSGGAATAVALARLPRAAVVELQPDPL